MANPETIEIRKSVLREVGRFFDLRTLRPHEAMDLECRIDDALDATVGSEAVAETARKLMEQALSDSEQEWEQARKEVRAAKRGLERLSQLFGAK